MIKPTGQLGITGSTKGQAKAHKTFTLPHSAYQANVSANYHGKVIDKLNPSDARANAVSYPQTGLGG
jgi:hypothetical protein